MSEDIVGQLRFLASTAPDDEYASRLVPYARDLLKSAAQEISDIREQLRISQENVRFLQMQMFARAGEPDAASEALRSALAGETAPEAISQPSD